MLLFNSADVHYENERGLLPLHLACVNGHRRVVEFLVKAGSDVTHASKHGLTAVQLADQNGHDDIVELLIEHGARLEQSAGDGGGSWTTYFKQMLTKAWTQSVRTLDYGILDDGRDGGGGESDEVSAELAEADVLATELPSTSSKKTGRAAAEKVVITKEPVFPKRVQKL
jgi:ankyrin repeat protein